jgi:hypothetical protein
MKKGEEKAGKMGKKWEKELLTLFIFFVRAVPSDMSDLVVFEAHVTRKVTWHDDRDFVIC